MRSLNLDRSWQFTFGSENGFVNPNAEQIIREVHLPHDYMIESDPTPAAPAGPASGYYTAGVATYSKKIEIPAAWENEIVLLHFDGVMMNATLNVNGCRVALQHNGYIPFYADITPYIYFGEQNRISVIVNPSMQPNSRWYSGAGIFRSVELLHVPRLHLAPDGIFGYTKDIEYDENGKPRCAYLHTEVELCNQTTDNKIALAEVFLTREGSDEVILSRRQKVQVNPLARETAYIDMTLPDPVLWDVDDPQLYRLHARVTDLGVFKTHFVPAHTRVSDEHAVLFGVRTVQADVNRGLRINGKTVKLKGGCIHHDNGMLGAVSLYESECRKIRLLKRIGFNAIRTTHNPPSAVLLEACDRLGMYVYNEAFDAWGIMKQPGDYNQHFYADWQNDLTAFMKRDRCHPSVILWSTGNEIPERGGMNNGYTLATELARAARRLDPSRPISHAICSYWSGLDDALTEAQAKKLAAGGGQNADVAGGDTSWEEYSEAFLNGLDIVGYNYMEPKYERDHEMYPERIILGSENYPKEIGIYWPMVERTPYVLGDFTWTAFDYIGEAGIGKTAFLEPDDPMLQKGPFALSSHASPYPWRLANDADLDINGTLLPQGAYRSVVWGSERTFVFSYDPAVFGKAELISPWGFTDVSKMWNWAGAEGKPVQVAVFSNADEVELRQNGAPVQRCKAGERLAADLPNSFLFDLTYASGTVEAVSLRGGKEISRDTLQTTGAAAQLRLVPEKTAMAADGHDVLYVAVELVDAEGRVVPDAALPLRAEVRGAAVLAAFGSAAPATEENYTRGTFTAYRGRAMAILRSGCEHGSGTLTVTAEGLAPVSVTVQVGEA